jgi:hypothetical protein
MRGSASRRLACAAALLLALLAARPARAAEALPPQVQASLFKRIFAYDPLLRGNPGLKVLVLHGRLTAERAVELVAAFEAEGVAAAHGELDAAPEGLDGRTVLYVLPDVPAAPLAELARGKRLLTLAGEPEAVTLGRVAVGLRRAATGQPEILVHLRKLAADGHELSARLLKLSTVLP